MVTSIDASPIAEAGRAGAPIWCRSGGQGRSDSGMGSGGQERSDSGMGSGGQERSDSGMGSGGQERMGRADRPVAAWTR
ncbi:hypothetical protein Y900_002365 [Mycolicibacterium aromaticivorans JS19b1 = JCM 16368]|uniref:Uncharacterized protein n=1 Tax=Mycolicibacterium aromaticivorans JS19b1 = JCM 16368 TaxID=1440774 RepID=A0A064CGG8_9MYCO|nr:hypothetical protein Y900_002365 [Mycolicibacterium aromaticivorans JS19b1 = JCM 16368]